MMVPVTSLVVLLSAILTALGDVQRPTQGYQLGNGSSSGVDIIFPLTIVQCDSVLIYYNLTDNNNNMTLITPTGDPFLNIYFPAGVGYVDWICNIPMGYSFEAHGFFGFSQYYTVQPGSSSACLGDLRTAYSYASYSTTRFQSYTQNVPNHISVPPLHPAPTTGFPTGSFPTITVNPNLAVAPTTTTFSVSSPLPSPTTSPSVDQLNTPVIAGGVFGGIAFVLLTITVIFVIRWGGRNPFSDPFLESASPYLMTQPRPTSHLPLPNSIKAVRRCGKFNIRRMRNHVPARKSRNRGPDSASAPRPDVTPLSASQWQALISSLDPSTNPAAPPAPADATQTPTAPLRSSVREAAQEDFPEIANVLGVISQLSPETRNALVTSLNNLLTMDRATPADLRRGITVTPSLPPYVE